MIHRLTRYAVYHTNRGPYRCKPMLYLGQFASNKAENLRGGWTFAPLFKTDHETRTGKYWVITHFTELGRKELVESLHLVEDCPDA